MVSLGVLGCGSASTPDGGVETPIDAASPVDAARSDASLDAALPAVFASLSARSEGIARAELADGTPVIYAGNADGMIVRIGVDGAVETLAAVEDPVGIAVRSDGDLVACARVGGEAALVGVSRDDGAVTELVGPSTGAPALGLCNFVAVAPDDSLVFSDSELDRLYRANADGTDVALITDAIDYPNGLAFSADGTTLFVASWSTDTLFALSFDASSGTYGEPMPSVTGVTSVDGIVASSDGSLLLITSSSGILRAHPGSDTTETLFASRNFSLPANGVLGSSTDEGDDAFGAGWLYLTSLGRATIERVYVGEVGVPLPHS